jgi:hypothetical protein
MRFYLKLTLKKHMPRQNSLQQTLRMNGFGPKCCNWTHHFVHKVSVRIRVNDAIGHYFQTKKVCRQGDPLFAILCNLIPYMMAILISRAN